MKIVVAPDSFKESLTAQQAAAAIAEGLRSVMPEVDVVILPLADGGEGTARILTDALGGEMRLQRVTGPLGESVDAAWGLCGDLAVIEMAAASGLELLRPAERNPMKASSRGTGELILAALDAGVQRVLVGLGGSATVDGGAGLLMALGARLLDQEGLPVGEGGGEVRRVERIDWSTLDARIVSTEVVVACDVRNPLCGPMGAARVFGGQKGASAADIEALDASLSRLGELLSARAGFDVASVPGAGAAGGAAAALIALGGRVVPGVDAVCDAVDLEHHLEGASYVITGEGALDAQSMKGKVPSGVARRAALKGVPVLAVCGRLACEQEDLRRMQIKAAFSVLRKCCDWEQARTEAYDNLRACAANIGALIAT